MCEQCALRRRQKNGAATARVEDGVDLTRLDGVAFRAALHEPQDDSLEGPFDVRVGAGG
jgi:hypothetical protein